MSSIGNMDETPLWLDMPGDTTVAHVGERSVAIRTTCHDKGRFTVIVAAMADRRKLKPFVVFKGVRPIAALGKVSGVVLNYSRNGWMNEELTVKCEELTVKWIESVWGSLSFSHWLLILDAYRLNFFLIFKFLIFHNQPTINK